MQPIGYTSYVIYADDRNQYGTFLNHLNTPPIVLDPSSELHRPTDNDWVNFSVLRPDETYDAGEFIPSNKPQYDLKEPWKEEEEGGFDVYIDAIHNLPDNSSVVKILAEIVNNRGVKQIKTKELWPKLEVSTFQK